MSDILRSTFVGVLNSNDDDPDDVSRLYYKRFDQSEWSEIEVDDLEWIEEDTCDEIIAYTPERIYVASAAYGGPAKIQFSSAPRHFAALE